MTLKFLIKLQSFLKIFFESYQSQCSSIFSEMIIKKYGNVLYLNLRYYQPSRISVALNVKYLVQLNKILNKVCHIEQSTMSRIICPAIDSYILAQYFTYMTMMYNFRQICQKMEQIIMYKHHTGSINQIKGIQLSLHGRIPREPVRPRKTIQSRILGTHGNKIINSRSMHMNPELGSFSI